MLLKYFYSANTWEEMGQYFNKLNLGNPDFDPVTAAERKDFVELFGGKYRVIHINFKLVKG